MKFLMDDVWVQSILTKRERERQTQLADAYLADHHQWTLRGRGRSGNRLCSLTFKVSYVKQKGPHYLGAG